MDVPSAQGARLAVKELNRAGGVLGRRLELVLEDGQTDPAVVRSKTAQLLTRTPAPFALMGLSDTDMVLAAAPLAAAYGRLFLTSGATSPRLPSQVPDALFLACFGDNVQAAAAAEWAYRNRSARRAAVLFDATTSYTRLLHGYFETRFKELGGEVLTVQSYEPGNFDPPLKRLLENGLGGVDILFLAAEQSKDALAWVHELRDAGFTAPILGGDGFDDELLWDEHRDVSGVFFTTHAYLGADNPDPRVVAFRAAYRRAYRGDLPDAFAALGYDSVGLLAAAVVRAGSSDPAAVRGALADIRQFDGVTGSMGYREGERIPTKSVAILEIDRGRRRLVRQLLPERVPPHQMEPPGDS